jgi:hypothetical protein
MPNEVWGKWALTLKYSIQSIFFMKWVSNITYLCFLKFVITIHAFACHFGQVYLPLNGTKLFLVDVSDFWLLNSRNRFDSYTKNCCIPNDHLSNIGYNRYMYITVGDNRYITVGDNHYITNGVWVVMASTDYVWNIHGLHVINVNQWQCVKLAGGKIFRIR